MKPALFIAAAILGILPGRLTPDVSLPLIEYRLLAPLGQVRLTRGVVHDEQVQKTMLGDLAVFDRQGLVLVAGDSTRALRRRETIAGHLIETVLRVYPATGHGYRGGLATADVVVSVDGAKKIDCPFVGGSVDLSDIGILPSDGFITISGSVGEKHVDAVLRFTDVPTIDLGWLDEHAR